MVDDKKRRALLEERPPFFVVQNWLLAHQSEEADADRFIDHPDISLLDEYNEHGEVIRLYVEARLSENGHATIGKQYY
ncbi:MAG: hypothetical protein ACRDHN_08670, partial [Thermomicrobiales bacterium]